MLLFCCTRLSDQIANGMRLLGIENSDAPHFVHPVLAGVDHCILRPWL